MVSVLGEGFEATAKCLFGAALGPTTFQTTSLLQCISPASSAGYTSVRVSMYAGQVSNGVSFRMVLATTVLAIEPAQGPVQGGYMVTLIGATWLQESDLVCHFHGLQSTEAVWKSSSQILCTVPTASQVGVVDVSIEHVGSKPSTSKLAVRVPFEYNIH